MKRPEFEPPRNLPKSHLEVERRSAKRKELRAKGQKKFQNLSLLTVRANQRADLKIFSREHFHMCLGILDHLVLDYGSESTKSSYRAPVLCFGLGLYFV